MLLFVDFEWGLTSCSGERWAKSASSSCRAGISHLVGHSPRMLQMSKLQNVIVSMGDSKDLMKEGRSRMELEESGIVHHENNHKAMPPMCR